MNTGQPLGVGTTSGSQRRPVTGAEQETFGAKPLRTSAAVSTYLHTASAGSARVGHFHNRMAQIADRMRL